MWQHEQVAMIYVVTEEKLLNFKFHTGETIEDLCIQVCKSFNIGPVARHLFGLQSHSSKIWYPYGYKLENGDKNKFDFRLRFKPASIQKLKQIDEQAYNYYFQQARNDIMDNNVPDIIYEKHKRELIGLGVSDMYRVMLEKQIPRETVESDYKKYIPKECIKRHAFFIKKPIHNALGRISGHDASYVKEQYLKQFECIAPNYPYEEYKALMDKGVPNPPAKVLLRVNIENVKYCETEAGTWNILCAIEDLCFISIRQDNTVEISRKSGIPSYLKFSTTALLMSFVSALDGYYRLAIKWTFNLCRDVVTPTLERLHNLRCHGPIGKEFSYIKLREKRANKPGTYILRESETEYNVYYIDVCNEDGKLLSQRVEQTETNKFLISDRTETYDSLGHLISSFQDCKDLFRLLECLPSSEYDKSPLLICAAEDIGNEVAADEKIIAALLEGGPRCVSRNQLQVCKPFAKSDEDLTRMSATRLHRAMWRVAKGKKLEVAMKMVKSEENNYTKEFLELIGKWSQLRSGALVRLYGITVTPIGMLFELVKLGPLDKYLQSNSSTVKTVDLVEATTCVATALWHLEENGVVHGNIRCDRLLVHVHTNNSFIIKLADPGLFTYIEADIHWIPPECYKNLESAKRSFQADIWALATTIWQIFSRGSSPPTHPDINVCKKLYQSGKRLPAPNGCPQEVYKLMIECWGSSNAPRKQPQAIMRDINQILYQVYNSRRTHAYATAFPKLFNDINQTDEDDSDTTESKSVNSESLASSLVTDHTSLNWDDTDDVTKQLVNPSESDTLSTEELPFCVSWLTNTVANGNECNTWTLSGADNDSAADNHRLTDDDSFSDMVRLGNETTNDKDNRHVFEMDMDTVIQQGLIGQGFYGEVYRGMLEKQGKNEMQQVAVKKLKTIAIEAIRDFEREISIMKTLKHTNIVEILGVTTEGHLVMEYIKHGSLQSYLAIHRRTLNHKKLLSFALDIVTGMDYLGRMNVVHRDLAARNILVANEDLVKISDFGLAQVIGKNDYYILQTDRDLPIKWYAPESLRYGKFSPRSDVWSFGVTMYEIFSLGEDPKLPGVELNHKNGGVDQGSSADLLAALERGTRLPCPPMCPQTVYVKLMYPCWDIHSHGRPNFATLREDILELLSEY